MPRYKSIKKEQSPKKRGLFHIGVNWFRVFIILLVIFAIFFSLYIKKLGSEVEERFNKPKKWNLPSRIYSDSEYIYPGYNIVKRDFIAKLDRLGYRNMGERISGVGEYALGENAIFIYLHNFEYPKESFKGFPVKLELSDSVVTGIKRIDTGENEDVLKLEPELISSFFDSSMEDRTLVTLEDVPPRLLETIVLMEDERFFKHIGVDPIGIFRATVANLAAGSIVQGGSTLTQQLVKNFFLHPRKSFIRKINEIIMAVHLERNHEKGEILQAYINEIYLGQRGASSVSGVAEASKLYFGKGIGSLTNAEIAQLVGMIRSPFRYNPFTKPQNAKDRRDFVLRRMLDGDLIDDSEYQFSINQPIITPRMKVHNNSAPYFIDFVRTQLIKFYPDEILQSEGLKIFTTLDMHAQIVAQMAVEEGLIELKAKLSSEDFSENKDDLETCLISLSPSTGYVRAMVGGKDYGESQFNRCSQAMRQPGSTFKPFVYLTAFDPARSEKTFTPSSIISDTSFEVEAGGEMWSPKNYDKQEHGDIPLFKSLEMSYNIATAKLGIEVGLSNVVNTARDAGISGKLLPVPSISLGSFEVTPLELASAYSIFPNQGIKPEVISVLQVMTKEGEVLEHKPIFMQRKFTSPPIFVTTWALKGVMERGTGKAASFWGINGDVAGKTGTTSDYRDAWFVGFNPSVLALSWVGFDDNRKIGMSGSQAALPIWARFARQIMNLNEKFSESKGIIFKNIDSVSGLLSNKRCPDFIEMAYLDGTEPEKDCER